MTNSIPVLICGAGPCGLATSYMLNLHGIKNLVIEKHPTTSIHPKARGVNVRTMELFHIWGLEQQLRQHQISYKSRRLLWMTGITGDILGQVALNNDLSDISPTNGCAVPQNFVEDTLVDALKDSKHSEIKFNTKLVQFEQHDDHVSCQLQNKLTNDEYNIQCEYLIAADGAHSPIRETLDLKMLGIPSLGAYITIYARVDLSPWLGDKQGIVYSFASKTQQGRFLMAVDHKKDWIFGQRLDDKSTPITEDYCKSIIKSFLDGREIDIDIISHSVWDMAALNCERYDNNRIFLVGDAAHRMPPTGGMGMNTGLHDAHNLAWKLAYVLNKYADKNLLATYQAERQPVAQFTLEWSGRNAQRMFKMHEAIHTGNKDLFEKGLKEQESHVNHPGLDLGFIYRSEAVYTDDLHPVEIDSDHYTPSSEPGMRAPHCEISINGKTCSILNLFQKNYTLLLAEDATLTNNDLPIPSSYPLKLYRHKKDFTDPRDDFISKYNFDNYKAVLIRPDGHIAWRC